MGQLEALCFAQGTDNTLYALAYGYDLSSQSSDNAVAALLKSNASPSSPSALTWQVVSTVRKGDLFTFLDGMWIQCVADPDGAFLVWSYHTYRPGQDKYRPGGFRYDPSLSTPSGTTTKTGKGGWVNVDTPINYSWSSSTSASFLSYLKDGSGKYSFYHAFSGGTTIYFGALNTATIPNMMENSATTWSVKSTITGYIEGMKATGTKLFVWGVAGNAASLFGMADLPQSSPLPTTGPSLQLGNYTTLTFCSNPGALGDKFYKYCRIPQTHGDEYKLFAWDGSKTLDPINMSQLPIKDTFSSAILTDIIGDSSSTYMLFQSGRLSPEATKSGNPGFGSYMLKALALTGAAAGSVLNVPNNITVPDNIAFYPSAAGGGDGLQTIIGLATILRWIFGILGALSVCCAIVCVRRRRQRAAVLYVQEPAPSMTFTQTTTTTFVARA